MTTKRFQIQNMHCGGCVRNVTRILSELSGVRVAAVGVGSAEVTVDSDAAARKIVTALGEAGYPAAETVSSR